MPPPFLPPPSGPAHSLPPRARRHGLARALGRPLRSPVCAPGRTLVGHPRARPAGRLSFEGSKLIKTAEQHAEHDGLRRFKNLLLGRPRRG
jgi:hypothetical protein